MPFSTGYYHHDSAHVQDSFRRPAGRERSVCPRCRGESSGQRPPRAAPLRTSAAGGGRALTVDERGDGPQAAFVGAARPGGQQLASAGPGRMSSPPVQAASCGHRRLVLRGGAGMSQNSGLHALCCAACEPRVCVREGNGARALRAGRLASTANGQMTNTACGPSWRQLFQEVVRPARALSSLARVHVTFSHSEDLRACFRWAGSASDKGRACGARGMAWRRSISWYASSIMCTFASQCTVLRVHVKTRECNGVQGRKM